jgi:4-hydroxy-tetrahydrodipicolinate reductase
MPNSSIPLVHVGLGPLGIRLLQLMAERPVFSLTGAVDINPDLFGQDVAHLTGKSQFSGIAVNDSLPNSEIPGQAVAILTTVSAITRIERQIKECLHAGYHVVTTCEELAYPWRQNVSISKTIDDLAREKNLAVLGTGINPGFMMDFLPQVLTAISSRVDKITIERFQDASLRRIPFQKKVGTGLSPEAFKQRVVDGSLRHVGLEESLHFIAQQLGWKLDRTEDSVVPIVAKHTYQHEDVIIAKGDCLGVSQTGRGYRDGKEVLTLLFKAAAGLTNPHDKISITGDPTFESIIPGGIGGDDATCSILLNACRAIRRANPGLRTMAEVPGISWFDRIDY